MDNSRMNALGKTQSGFILITALVMMVVLTILAMAAINMTNVNTKIAYNSQLRVEAQAATDQAIEQVVSNAVNFTPPLPAATTVAVDINNDGVTDYTVAVPTPVCVASTPIKQSQLNSTSPTDIPCFGSSSMQNAGIVGGTGSSGNSLCANTTWDVQATYADPGSTGLNVVTHQGVNLRVVAGTTC